VLKQDIVWTKRRIKHLQEMSGVSGKTPGESVITSMGSTAPPSVETPVFILDYLVSDGAQVTRPSIDPYREPIETHVYLAGLRIRLSMPVILSYVDRISERFALAFVRAAYNMGILTYMHTERYLEVLNGYEDSLIVSYDMAKEHSGKKFAAVINDRKIDDDTPFFYRIESTDDKNVIREAVESGAEAIIVDEDIGAEAPLEVAVSEVDRFLRGYKLNREPIRNKIGIIACSWRIRGADDVFKLMGLGADCVALSDAAIIAAGIDKGAEKLDLEIIQDRLENFLIALQKEIKLLAGAAGVSSLYSSLVGSRELFRAIGLERAIRERIGVKPAGVG